MEIIFALFFVLVIIPLAVEHDVSEMRYRRNKQTEEEKETLDKDK